MVSFISLPGSDQNANVSRSRLLVCPCPCEPWHLDCPESEAGCWGWETHFKLAPVPHGPSEVWWGEGQKGGEEGGKGRTGRWGGWGPGPWGASCLPGMVR